MKTNNTHGGSRPGAGRPKIENKKISRSVRLDDNEFVKVKEYIKQIRK